MTTEFMIYTPDSSAIDIIKYCKEDRTLILSFKKSGNSYLYNDIDPSIFYELKQVKADGGSIGKYFNKNIRKYQGLRLLDFFPYLLLI